MLASLPLSGRELIWNVDGLNQYYSFFLYEGEWIRGIVSGVVSGNGFNVPLWEWHSGYGADVPTTFDVFLDPLNLVSAITPPAVSEWVFQLLVVCRLYLAGLAFVFYCRTRGESRTGTVLGALLYALCGTGLVGIRWASGLHAFILFPVILAGAERVLAKGKPWVFVASLTALAVISYYFTFTAVILLVGYLALRVVMVERPHLTAKRFMRWAAVFAGLSALCAVLAAFALVPAVFALLGMDRFTGGAVVVPWLYAPSYYIALASSFLSTSDVVSDVYLGYGGLAFFACIALFMRKGENRELKWVFVILSAFFLIPAVGSFFNGMNYATNRWAWAYTLCVAYALARTTPTLLTLSAGEKRVMVASALVYGAFFLVPAFRTEANVAGFVALLVALMVLVAEMEQGTRRTLLGCALTLALVVNGFYFLSPAEGGQGTGEVPLASAYAKLTSASADSIALEANDDTWWRYDAGQVSFYAHAPMNRIANNSLILGLNGIDFYNTVYNSAVDAFHTELAIAGDNMNFRYTNLQGRADIMALLGVKYYAYRNDGTDTAPYGFDVSNAVAQRSIAGVDYQLARSDAFLPMGFAFDKAIARSDYLELPPVKRQQALLQAVVLDGLDGRESGASSASADELSYGDSAVPYDVASATGVALEEGRFVVSSAGGSITLSCEGKPNAETYVYVDGLRFVDMKPSEFSAGAAPENEPWYYRANRIAEDLAYVAVTEYEVSFKGDAAAMTGYVFNDAPQTHTYGGKHEWLVNLGYSEQPVQQVTISFNKAGAYEFDDLQVIAETHDQLGSWTAGLSAASLENVDLGCNTLTGSIGLDAPKTLLITVARANGWTAYVDGEPAELLRADTAFMGLDLPAGHHDIELRYFTPGLAEGAALTGVGVVALIILVFALRARDRKQPGEPGEPGKPGEPGGPGGPGQGTEQENQHAAEKEGDQP